MIIAIVAVDRNGAIGKGGEMPWHYSSDMKHFKETTMGHVCVMGRKTWQTLKRPLKDRLNIVMSRQAAFDVQDSIVILHDVGSAISLSPYLKGDLFVIGGQKIFEAFLTYIEKWIVTEVPLTVDGADAYVPKNYLDGFKKTDSKQLDDELTVSVYERL